MDTLISGDNWGAWHNHIFAARFAVATLITDVLFDLY